MSAERGQVDYRELLGQAYLTVEKLKARVGRLERERSEPIAIVGMACRLPGGIDTPEAFWETLLCGVDAITEVPKDRWDADAIFDPDPDAPGRTYSKWGGFIHGVDGFDPAFFGISPREAVSLDPQQRLLLEVSWEALERASLSPARLEGTSGGVFVGISTGDYAHVVEANGAQGLDIYSGTGNTQSIAAGRIAYALGLHGPCVALDTACSSSLVAVHLAARSLRSGECAFALAGGVNLMLTPHATLATSKGRMLSFVGRCQTFDAAADGYVRGEGCGMVVLKRLSDAIAAGDPIVAVIRGSAVNQDGRSSGLTAPNGTAQEALLKAACEDAGVPPSRVNYIEAHGTGTSLGDPIEMRALGAALGPGRPPGQRLLIGSAKTNIGHLEAAAGIAGLIKTALVLQHGIVPPHLHFKTPSPHIPWAQLPVDVPTAPTALPRTDGPRVAGVSSFGFSGTNAHVLLEEATAAEPAARANRAAHLFTVSARSDASLRALAVRHADHLERHPDLDAADVCHSVNAGRSHFPERLTVIGTTLPEIAERLRSAAGGTTSASVRRKTSTGARRRVAFLFTGQGSQTVGMGRELFEREPVFTAAMNACDEILQPLLPTPLLAVLYPGAGADAEAASLLNQTQYAQPALFAFEYALAALWRSWGIEPSAVAGHSVGEYVAACVAGALSLEDALSLIAHRGRLMQALPTNGSMLAVFAGEPQVARAIAPYARTIAFAAFNSPSDLVISGLASDLQLVAAELQREGVETKPLTVSHAFHSPLMREAAGAFAAVAARIQAATPRLRFVSNVTGRSLGAGESLDAQYWARHILEPVRFADSVRELGAHGYEVFLEVGPAAVLSGLGPKSLAGDGLLWLASCRRGIDPGRQMLGSLAELYLAGVPIDWEAVGAAAGRRRLALPTYPFERTRYWVDAGRSPRIQAPLAPDPAAASESLLGVRVRSPLTRDVVFETHLTTASHPFVADHVVFGAPVFPATGYVALALAGARAVFGEQPLSIEDLSIEEALLVSDDSPRLMQLVLTPAQDGQSSFQVFSSAIGSDDDATWTRHASGRVTVSAVAADDVPVSSLDAIRERCTHEVDVAELYAHFDMRGIEYGPRFRGMSEVWQGDNEAIARLKQPEALLADAAGLAPPHPAFVDAAFQVLGAATTGHTATDDSDVLFLPVAVGRLKCAGPVPASVWSHARLHRTQGADTLTADLRWFDDEGRTLLTAEGVVLKRVSGDALRRAADRKLLEWVYEVEWQPAPATGKVALQGQWLVLGADATVARLVERLVSAGARPVAVLAGDAYRFAGDRATLDPSIQDHLARLVADAGAAGPIAGVIHALAADVAEPATPDELDRMQAAVCGSGLALAQALGAGAMQPRLMFVTRGAQAVGLAPWPTRADQTALWGLARVVAIEQPQLRCTIVDLDPGDPAASADHIVAEALAGGDENQVAFRAGHRYAARLMRRSRAHGTERRLTIPSGESFQLTTTARGVLDNLVIAERRREPPGPGQIEVRVHAAGLNFRDVLNALGMYPGDPGPMGGECAGRVARVGDGVTRFRIGDDVLCLAGGSFGKYVVTADAAAVELPAGLSYEQGASLPVTFLTAHYGLHHLAGIKKGDRVLVHAAAGGVGQAAVQIALRAGAEVYGTAGSPEKRDFVKAMGVRAVFNSRTADFVEELRALTDGHGVDIVLNSLTGAFIPQSLAVLAPGGHFLEIGKAEIWTTEAAAAINPSAIYKPFDLGEVMVHDLPVVAHMLADVMAGLADGSLHPLPTRVFDFDDAMSAYRFMAQAKHVGKIVLSQRGLLRDELPRDAEFGADGAYLVTGGCGGLGLKVAAWLVGRGVRHLVLMGRSAPTAAAGQAIQELEQAGAVVTIARADVSSEEDLRRVLATIDASGTPLRGVIHTAGVLDDGVLAEQTWPRFANVLAPKVRGGRLLHELTRDRRLDCFVLFSSTSAVFGAPGQANYAAANAYLDGLAQYRSALGLPALSINWGAWGEVGMAARLDARDRSRLAERGLNLIPPAEGLRVMGHLMRGAGANAVVLPIRWDALVRSFPNGSEPPLLRIMARDAGPRPTAHAADLGAGLAQRLENASGEERRELLVVFLRAQLARVLGLDNEEQLDIHTQFGSLGLDSLMAVEVRNAVSSALGRPINASVVFEHPTIDGLAARLLSMLTAADGAGHAKAPASPDTGINADVSLLTDDEVNALLATLIQSDPAAGTR